MAAREADLWGYALFGTIMGNRPPICLGELVLALQFQCDVLPANVKVQVTSPPNDFFIQFKVEDDCSRVLATSRNFRYKGAYISFSRWCRGHGGTSSELGFLTKLSFDGLPQEAWESEALSRLINQLHGHLVQVIPPSDSWSIEVLAWMKNPSSIRKEYIVEFVGRHHLKCVHEAARPEELLLISLPSSPTKVCTEEHKIVIHVEEVIDHSPINTDLPSAYCENYRSTKRKHQFPVWSGVVDGTGPSPDRDGAHCFAGPSAQARSGEARFREYF